MSDVLCCVVWRTWVGSVCETARELSAAAWLGQLSSRHGRLAAEQRCPRILASVLWRCHWEGYLTYFV